MVEEGQVRMMRDGTPVMVTKIFPKFSRYWQRDMPHVELADVYGQFTLVRSLATTASYPLHPNYQ